MSFGLKQSGERFILYNSVDNIPVEVSLYDDSTDDLGRNPTENDITTEPENISRKESTITLTLSGKRWQFTSSSSITFNTSNSSGRVDGYFTRIDSNNNGDYDTFFIAGALEEPEDIENIDELEVKPGVGGRFVSP